MRTIPSISLSIDHPDCLPWLIEKGDTFIIVEWLDSPEVFREMVAADNFWVFPEMNGDISIQANNSVTGGISWVSDYYMSDHFLEMHRERS